MSKYATIVSVFDKKVSQVQVLAKSACMQFREWHGIKL